MVCLISVLFYVVGFVVLIAYVHKAGLLDGSQVFAASIWPILVVVLGLFWLWTLTPPGKQFLSDISVVSQT